MEEQLNLIPPLHQANLLLDLISNMTSIGLRDLISTLLANESIAVNLENIYSQDNNIVIQVSMSVPKSTLEKKSSTSSEQNTGTKELTQIKSQEKYYLRTHDGIVTSPGEYI